MALFPQFPDETVEASVPFSVAITLDGMGYPNEKDMQYSGKQGTATQPKPPKD